MCFDVDRCHTIKGGDDIVCNSYTSVLEFFKLHVFRMVQHMV